MTPLSPHTVFHRLRRQRQRLSAIRYAAIAYDRRDIVTLAEQYAGRLTFFAKRCRPADAGYVAGMIGGNGIGPAIDALALSVRYERRLHREQTQHRIVQNRSFSSGTPAGEEAGRSPVPASSNFMPGVDALPERLSGRRAA